MKKCFKINKGEILILPPVGMGGLSWDDEFLEWVIHLTSGKAFEPKTDLPILTPEKGASKVFFLQTGLMRPYLSEKIRSLPLPAETLDAIESNLVIADCTAWQCGRLRVKPIIDCIFNSFPENPDVVVVDCIRNLFSGREELFGIQEFIEFLKRKISTDLCIIIRE